MSLPGPHTVVSYPHLFRAPPAAPPAEGPGRTVAGPAALVQQFSGLICLESLITQEVP